LKNPVVATGLYNLMTAVTEETRRQWWGLSSDHPGSMLYGSVDLMETFLDVLRKIRGVAEENARVSSRKVSRHFFAMLRKELHEEYLSTIRTI